MKTIFTVLWLLSNGDIESVQEGPEFATMEECLAYKHQHDFMPRERRPQATGGYLSYCNGQ